MAPVAAVVAAIVGTALRSCVERVSAEPWSTSTMRLSSPSEKPWGRVPRSRLLYSIMLLALRRDGMAGVCGVRGEIRSPGEVELDKDVAATMGGTLDSWRLEELDERWSMSDEDIESDSAALESRSRWNLDKAALVRFVDASTAWESDGVWKLLSSFF